MAEENLFSTLAELLRPGSRDIFNGKGKLCLSTSYLQKINLFFDENIVEELTSSFHSTTSKTTFQRDVRFLFDLIGGAIALKITSDFGNNDNENEINLKRFKSIKCLDIDKVDTKKIIGIQKLRPQIQELTCSHSLQCVPDILEKCGGDMSQGNLWSELRKLNLQYNYITEIDNSFESTPWLVTLDLSHNMLSNVDLVNCLPNLKHLNVSYNKLDKVPSFKGQIGKTLQVLILSNNFIEDISNILTLSNILQIDLSQNSIIDHNSLQSVSHLPSLHLLNLQGNPIYFHPNHRTVACQYLNKDTSTLNFILNSVSLNKSEKRLVGLLRPVVQINSLNSSNNSSINSLENSVVDRPKKVRDVVIEDENNAVVEVKKLSSTPKLNTSHLEMKKQIEQLRQQHGDSWLFQQSGEIFQDVLGFSDRSITVLSSTPCDDRSIPPDDTQSENISSVTEKFKELDISAVSEGLSDTSKAEQVQVTKNDENQSSNIDDELSDELLSDDEDISNGKMFCAASVPDSADYDLVILVGETSLSEREATSVKETARWSINAFESCERGSKTNEVHLIFDTVRKNRKSRTYYLEEPDQFVELIKLKKAKIPENKITYECIKCNKKFSRSKIKRNESTEITCPHCNSVHIVESQ